MSETTRTKRLLPEPLRRTLRAVRPWQPWRPPLNGPVSRLKAGVARLLVGGPGWSTEWALRKRLGWGGGAFPPPRRPAHRWVNTTLKSQAQVDEAMVEVRACGLPPNGDLPKNWDALTALSLVLERTRPTARVLDAGAPLYSVILPWLYMYGYRDLWGIDLGYRRPVRWGPIRFERGDLTRTRFANGSFDAVTCLSVIEHGVPFEGYFAEMRRLLRPDGLLVTSTDYWAEGVDTRGQEAFGVPIKIFSRPDMEAFLASGRAHGFTPLGAVDLECAERVVRWEPYGLAYTFLTFGMTRAA